MAIEDGGFMEIYILGLVSVSAHGGRTEIRANKVRAMLATLALDAGKAIAHVELADELWSGQPVGNTLNALQATATRIRKVLDDPGSSPKSPTVLRAVRNGYLLDVPPACVDGNRFLDLAAQGSAMLHNQPEQALELLQSSLELWRGPALLDAGDGLRCRGAAALYDERRMTVWEDLISARLAVGDERQAISELQQLTAQYPLRERFCELLMLALYRTGRQGEALDVFQTTWRRLDEELAVQPGIPLQRRHAEILAQDPALTDPSAVWSGHRAPGARGLDLLRAP
ncbi:MULTISPECIES: AfsR/SARP family transcriptional regulator [unclassified Streptomyces]|uniref:AfsR/SARP family transcriptional regulator n=1 Tax=unclassified Streptomyces TaxID=2593676 RepID=UPI001EF30B40|nr:MULTISPECIES: AfsR/SARP family transcriptional regulator [unclassified Streptomyces]